MGKQWRARSNLRSRTLKLTTKETMARKRCSKAIDGANNRLDDFGLRLLDIDPRTPAQEEVFERFFCGDNVLLHGSAGTGKTFIAMYLALWSATDWRHPQKSVTIVRSAVPTRDIGYLPGDEKKKTEIYELPYKSICTELFGRSDAYEILKQKGRINFITTSHIRGITVSDTVVLIDEVQNMTDQEINTIITRLGENARLLLCGDKNQDDLSRKRFESSGVEVLRIIASKMRKFSTVEFGHSDIVRSDIVKEWIIARDTYISNNATRRSETFYDSNMKQASNQWYNTSIM